MFLPWQSAACNVVDMSRTDPKWTATSGPDRPVYDERGQIVGHETWAIVEDGRGGRWTVTIADDRLTSLTVHSDNVKQADLRAVPLMEIRTVARAYVREVDRLRDEGHSLDDALDNAEHPDLMPDGQTIVEDFLTAWRDAGPRPRPDGGMDRTPRRAALAERFGVSIYTIDKWVRSLRDRDLLDESAIRRNKTSDADTPDDR